MIQSYRMYHRLGRSVVFKGLAGHFIWWMGAALVILLLFFAILYLLAVPLWICVVFAIGGGTVSYWLLHRFSSRYGENGWMKHRCRQSIPITIKGYYFG